MRSINPWANMTDADVLAELEKHFRDSSMEILVIIEGIDPTCSQTLQSCYSYRVRISSSTPRLR